MKKVEVSTREVATPKVQVGQEYAIKPSEAYAGFTDGNATVLGVVQAGLVPEGVTATYNDNLESLSDIYTEEEYDAEHEHLNYGLWVAISDSSEPDGYVWVPQYLLLDHATLLTPSTGE